jgi:hypothetical protein
MRNLFYTSCKELPATAVYNVFHPGRWVSAKCDRSIKGLVNRLAPNCTVVIKCDASALVHPY